jgi:hypothetical protein
MSNALKMREKGSCFKLIPKFFDAQVNKYVLVRSILNELPEFRSLMVNLPICYK